MTLSAAITADSLVAGTAKAGTRSASFDFVKGALVLVMILYHWLNYFIGLQWGGYRYLRFLTPSFIFITGFLVSYVYLSRYEYDDSRLRRRLWLRGLKLLALFLFLNVLADRTLGMRLRLDFSDPDALRDTAYAVFVDGTARAAFDILVSISYFLLLVPFVLFVSVRMKIPLWALAAAAVLVTVAGESNGFANPHCQMLTVGLLGLAAGMLRADRAALLCSPVFIVCTYLVYLIAITAWNVPFALQIVGVCLSVAALYAIAQFSGADGIIQGYVVRLGQYSLLAYIAQIIVLQLLRHALSGRPMSGVEVAAPLVISLVATVVVVELTLWLRARSTALDRSYRAVFA